MLTSVAKQLEGETANLDAQVLLGNILNRSRTWVVAHPEKELTNTQISSVEQAVLRLLSGEPLPYILGRWEFYGLEFEVTPQALIPRPETELLVERAIAWLKANPAQRSMLEIGSGTGCIAIAVAKHIRDIEIIASDISFQALLLAQRNARKHNVAGQINFLQADAFSVWPIPENRKFALICSNPPYIPKERLHNLPVYKREPTSALDGGPNGLSLIARILAEAHNWLSKPGLLLVEIDSTHGDTVQSMVTDHFSGGKPEVLKDLAGHDRVLSIERCF